MTIGNYADFPRKFSDGTRVYNFRNPQPEMSRKSRYCDIWLPTNSPIEDRIILFNKNVDLKAWNGATRIIVNSVLPDLIEAAAFLKASTYSPQKSSENC